MFNVRLAGDHLYGKRLFTWLSLVMSLPFTHEMSWMRSGTKLSQFLRIFFYLPFHMKACKRMGMKIRTIELSHMTKMAAMPIYGQKLFKDSSPEPIDR